MDCSKWINDDGIIEVPDDIFASKGSSFRGAIIRRNRRVLNRSTRRERRPRNGRTTNDKIKELEAKISELTSAARQREPEGEVEEVKQSATKKLKTSSLGASIGKRG